MRSIAAALLAFGFCQSARATTWFVDDDASAGNDGLSWATAFDNLNSALDAAVANDEILVAGGTYTPDEGPGRVPGDRSETFLVTADLTIRGGYAGVTAANPDERDLVTHETILSGDLLGNDAPGFVNYDDNSLTVVTIDTPTAHVELEGLTIRGGNKNGTNGDYLDVRGGGVSLLGSTLLARHCRFLENSAAVAGGGIYVSSFDASFEHCQFLDNRVTDSVNDLAEGGGAIASDVSNTHLYNCVLARNRSNLYGGAISQFYPSITLVHCVLTNNDAGISGGGLMATGPVQPMLINTIAWGNRIGNTSGALFANFRSYSFAFIQASDIEGLSDPAPPAYVIVDSIDVDPLFVDASIDDYHLSPLSPCIDAGDDASVASEYLNDVDIDGEARLAGCNMDMGVDESPGGPPGSGDMTGDGEVNGEDIQFFVSILLNGSAGVCLSADLNGDGSADAGDIPSMIIILLNP